MQSISYAYNRFCTERFSLPTEAQVSALERRIGASFPGDYRHYLLTFNGGYFDEPEIEPTTDECPREALTEMHGIGAVDSSAELASDGDLVLFDDNDPPLIVPIGSTDLGGLIILVVEETEQRGSILLKEAFGDFYYLADGIEEFFDLLRTPVSNPDP